jgi:hypothetical protein
VAERRGGIDGDFKERPRAKEIAARGHSGTEGLSHGEGQAFDRERGRRVEGHQGAASFHERAQRGDARHAHAARVLFGHRSHRPTVEDLRRRLARQHDGVEPRA